MHSIVGKSTKQVVMDSNPTPTDFFPSFISSHKISFFICGKFNVELFYYLDELCLKKLRTNYTQKLIKIIHGGG